MADPEIYESLLDVPEDEHDPAEDGDDSLVPATAPYAAPLVVARAAGPVPQRVVAPFPGALQQGSRSKAVRAINKGLAKAGFRRWQVFSFVWTRWTTRAYVKFLRSRGLRIERDSEGRPVYTRAAHAKLAPYFDAYDLKYLLLAPKPRVSRDDRERAAFLANLMYVYNRRWSIAYTQARPWDRRRPPRGLDCSASGDWSALHSRFARGLSGWTSWGYGNTWTQLSWLRARGRLRGSSAVTYRIGDPVYYGRGGSPTHVAYWIGGGRVWSFGSYPAKILPIDYRSDRIVVCDLTGR